MKKTLILFVLLAMTLSCTAQRVLMMGDSHVAGNFYPKAVEKVLKEKMPDMQFDYWGINGAGFYTFLKPDKMAKLLSYNPEIMIVNLGTNDSYTSRFKPETLTANMQKFYDTVRDSLPECQFVFITPFFNKLKDKKTGTWSLNESCRTASETINAFAQNHPGCSVVDYNADHGMEFIDKGLIRKDFVHLSIEGYRVFGTQVAESLLKLPVFGAAETCEEAEDCQHHCGCNHRHCDTPAEK